MSQFVNPFVQHFDSNGDPNASYKVFFGQPNQDPLAFPKVVYSDKAFQNPIGAERTLDDKGSYGIDIFLKDKYSIRIETPLGSLWRESPFISGVGNAENIIVIDTVADLVATDFLAVGDLVDTKGYYTEGDIGAARYLIEASQVVDEFGDHTLGNGLVAILQKTGLVTAFQYGALDSIDSGPRVQAALDKHTVIRGGPGTFRLDSLVSFTEGRWLCGKGTTIILTTSNDNADATRISIDGINAGYRDCHFVPEGISGATGIVRSPVRITKSNFKAIRNFWEGSSTTVRFVEVQGFQGISSGDNFTVENTEFDGNQYTWCSNCIHELVGYTANNTSIHHEFAYLTPGNFINFNGEKLDPDNNPRLGTNNVSVTDCIVKDIGYADDITGGGGFTFERRFFAATLVDNIIITGNIIDHVYGDAPIHLERPGKFTIADNAFLNCHGSLAKAISIEAGSVGLDGISGPEWDNPELNGSITGNMFDFRDADNANGQDSNDIINTAGAVTFENLNISGNTFIWYEPGNYPKTPSLATVASDSLRAININQSIGKRVIENNRFLNMRIGLQVSNETTYGGEYDNNYCRNCEDGVIFGGLSVRPQSFRGWEFKGCTNPWTLDTDFPPLEFGGHNVVDCENALVNLLDPNWTQNLYTNVTNITDAISSGVTITSEGAGAWDATSLGKMTGRMNGSISVRISRVNAIDRRITNFDFGFRETGEFDATSRYTAEIARVGAADSIPLVTLTEFVGSLIIDLSGGTTDFDYFAVVKIDGVVDIN